MTSPSQFRLPEVVSVGDAGKAVASIMMAVGRGELTPAAAGELARVIIAFVKSIEAADRKSGGAAPGAGGAPPEIGKMSREELLRKLEERGLPTSLFGVDVIELEPESEDSRQPETAGQDG